MTKIPNTKRNRALVYGLPIAIYLVITEAIVFLWQHPHLPAHATDAQIREFMQVVQQDIHLQMTVLSALIAIPIIGAMLGTHLLGKQPVEQESSDKVAVLVDAKWVKIVRSPLYFVVAALSGVAVTFCPRFIFFCGKGMFGKMDYVIAVLCFLVTYGVSLFYLKLSGGVITELRKMSLSTVDQRETVAAIQPDIRNKIIPSTLDHSEQEEPSFSTWSQSSSSASQPSTEPDAIIRAGRAKQPLTLQ